VLALADAHRRGALARGGAGVHAASAQGRPLLVIILACAAASAATMVAVRVVEQRVVFSATVRRVDVAALAVAALAVLAGAMATYGSPLHMASRVRHALESKPPALDSDQNLRLETLSLNGRPMLWRSALADVGDHPLLGSGAGNDAYCIIAQGKVDVLLQASTKDRRTIFEEAAGISRFKAKKIETLRKLEHVVPADELYILPVSYKGRSCYRLCWGVYRNEPEAASAAVANTSSCTTSSPCRPSRSFRRQWSSRFSTTSST
jgi:hypothetical protein